MNYKDFNDYELLDSIYSVNEDASNILLYKYRPLIVNIAQKHLKYCNGGLDLNDLIQEGMLGLNDAIKSFDDNKEANFGTYAKLCIERKIKTLIKSSQSYKNRFLNDAVMLEYVQDDVTIDKNLMDNETNPDKVIEENENIDNLIKKLDEQLSDFERQVFELKMQNLSYREIAELLDKDPKIIDNTIQRVRNKLKKIIDNR